MNPIACRPSSSSTNHYASYQRMVAAYCRAQGHIFVDANALLGGHHEKWVFTDRIHYMDDGHRIIADGLRGLVG